MHVYFTSNYILIILILTFLYCCWFIPHLYLFIESLKIEEEPGVCSEMKINSSGNIHRYILECIFDIGVGIEIRWYKEGFSRASWEYHIVVRREKQRCEEFASIFRRWYRFPDILEGNFYCHIWGGLTLVRCDAVHRRA